MYFEQQNRKKVELLSLSALIWQGQKGLFSADFLILFKSKKGYDNSSLFALLGMPYDVGYGQRLSSFIRRIRHMAIFRNFFFPTNMF